MNFLSRMFLWIYKKSTEQRFDNSKRKISLKELIFRAESRLKLISESVYCPMCFLDTGERVPMMFRTSHVVDGSPCRDDQAYKCRKCFHTVHFGIPITRELVLEEIDLRGSHQILQPSAFKLPKTDPEIEERLKALGYLD
jgi:hypothetical protein